MKLKNLTFVCKIYVSAALVISAVFSNPTFSFVPAILLVWYLYEWRRPVSAMIDLLTQYFLFFALAVLFSSFIFPFLAPLTALPVLVLITHSLEKAASKAGLRRRQQGYSLTAISKTALALIGGVLIISVLITSVSLILACVILILYFIVMGSLIFRYFPAKPVAEEQLQLRIIAGKEEHLEIALKPLSQLGGLLFIESNQSWIKVSNSSLSLKQKECLLRIVLTPSLSGPTVVRLKGYAADRWGLRQTGFEIEPVKLYVVPRARYAAWLARKYLAGTRTGALPLLSSLQAVKPLQGLRQGLEYYGNRQYQAGDSLKNIDWKHSAKYDELISKEFTEFHGQPAIALINLESGDAEEADKLAYNIIITALTLGRENIPAALAVYNHEKVTLTTPALPPAQLILRSLQIVKEMSTRVNPVKYLNPPDIIKLRANINRLKQSSSQPARTLAGLLQLEYKSLGANIKQNPCTQALSDVMSKLSGSSSILILSSRNHDAEALAFNSFIQSQKGNAVINIG